MNAVLLDYKDLTDKGIKYSKEWLRQLERNGKFPKRIALSERRVAWRADEIDAHLENLGRQRTPELKSSENKQDDAVSHVGS